jgi:hypothetical protein
MTYDEFQDIPPIHKKKKKRSPSTPRFVRTLFLLTILLVIAFILFLISINLVRSPLQVEASGQEMLVIPFNKLQPTLTEHRYTNKVTLTISGTGQAGGKNHSDAFYLYADENGEPYKVPVKEAFDLEIDGQRAIITLGLRTNPPSLSPDHTYTVIYDVGAEARQIAFRISDSVVSDNTGQFMIKVVQGAR